MYIDEKTQCCHRLIDEHDVIEALERVYGLSGAVKSETMQAINGCPEVLEVHPFIHCADCAHWIDVTDRDGLRGYGYCSVNSGLWKPDEFCSAGVVR